jgi:hypothetical protein
MLPGVIQIPKYLDKETALEGQTTKVGYKPSAGKETKFLRVRNGDFRIAFTTFCPEHATSAHSGESCKAWATRARKQAAAKEKRMEAFETAQKSYQEKNERAFNSREAERRKE